MIVSFGKIDSFEKHRLERHSKLKKECNYRKEKFKNLPTKEMQTDDYTYIDPHYNCNRQEKNIVQKISYQSTSYFSNSCGSIDVNLSSACIKCGMCLAIAQQVFLRFSHYFKYNNNYYFV